MAEIAQIAREKMKGFCRVCKICDGRACIGEVPGMGGVGSGASFQANITALAKLQFQMRLIHTVKEPDTRCEFLGQALDFPLLAAPIAGISFNMSSALTEEEYIRTKLEACVEAGILGSHGDGVPPAPFDAGCAALEAVRGQAIPFLKPWDTDEKYVKLERVLNIGASIVGMDIDAAGLVTLRKMGRPVAPKTVQELKAFRSKIPGKFILKGIMTADDALKAIDAGADAIVVSNHGGRVLDHTPGTATVLPSIASAVKKQIAILVDGGVRSGFDILKMLALGADAVMIGRPFSIATIGGGKEGVLALISRLKTELIQAMVLTGTADIQSVSPNIFYQGRPLC